MVDVVYRAPAGRPARDVSLTLYDGASAGDVARALTGGGDLAYLVVDGRCYGPATALDDVPLCIASTVETVAGPTLPSGGMHASRAARWPVAEARVVGGLDGGQRFPLAPGSYLVGRAEGDGVDLALSSDTVSSRHALLSVEPSGACRLRDLGSRNGVRIEGRFVRDDVALAAGSVVEFGAVHMVVSPVAPDDRPLPGSPGGNGSIAFDRMPRTLRSSTPSLLKVPVKPAESDQAARLSVAAVVAPIAIAAVLFLVMPRNAMMLVFMALSPFLSIATWAEDRRRHRKQRAKRLEKYREAIAFFERDVHQAQRVHLLALRVASPDLAEAVRRALLPSARLWERRPAHDDFGLLRAGTADLPWQPPLEDLGEQSDEVAAVVAANSAVPLAPVGIMLIGGRCLGVVGSRADCLAVVRSLVVQAAVHHGPADLAICVLTQPDRVADWDWAKWLPHARTSAGTRLLAGTSAERQALAASLLRTGGDEQQRTAEPVHLTVMDADGITAGRNCAPRELLRGAGVPLAAIVIAERLDQLPGTCTDVIEITHPHAVGSYVEPAAGRTISPVLFSGASQETAQTVARALARFEDSDRVAAGAELPHAVPMPTLYDAESLTPQALARSWSGRRTGRLTAPIGAGVHGPLMIDLVNDGPHGLIAGTTGAGKSELLRTVIASLAASYSPRDVTFLLVDYKGGSAFAECSRLPHTVGMVTDLDEHLGSRALTCLEAELRHRERLLKSAGATDLLEYIAGGEIAGSLPRLVVAIDEFATLAAELPDFIDALVGVAQRGRSLGVHLLLATQRPRGAVNDNIRANTNLRIALRVHDAIDSSDVLDARDAAQISRLHPGRALLRLGPSELVAFQSAYISGTSLTPRPTRSLVGVQPAVFGPGDATVTVATPDEAEDDAPSDLARLVDAAIEAAARMGLPPGRQPWPDALPARLLLSELTEGAARGAAVCSGWSAPIGLADEPVNQRQVPIQWDSAAGGLLLYGVAGSGTSTALAVIALSLASRYSPAGLHLYVLDFGNQLLAPLASLPHTAAVLGPTERDRHERLIRRLRVEVSRRQEVLRTGGAASIGLHNERCADADRLPAIVLMLDNWSAFVAVFDDLPGFALRDELARVVADGPGLGIYSLLAADRATAIPASMAGLVTQRLVFALSDPHDFGAFAIPVRDLPVFVPGRAIDATTRREVQIALPGADGIPAAVAAVLAGAPVVDPARLPAPVLSLPADLTITDFELTSGAYIEDGDWWLPFGLGDRDLQPVGFRLREGDHALVAGPPRSGKSSLLELVARVAVRAAPSLCTVVIAPPRSPLRLLASATAFGTDEADAAVELMCAQEAPCLLIVDDAERVDDACGTLRRFIAQRRSDRIIAAGRADALRASYGHWTQEVRRSRQGVVLRPNPDADGDLWGMLLPRGKSTQFAPGRGYLVLDGEAELVQVARS
ncbi:MAG: FtsK/SpoIIIE domain-containing protein [Mycobacteriales bacterium]